jgi:anti-anti-sigma factor
MRHFRTYNVPPTSGDTGPRAATARSTSLDGRMHTSVRRPHHLLTVVSVAGEVDMDALQPLEDALARALPGAPGATLEIDLRDVTFMDAAGIGTLVRWRARLLAAGMTMVVRDPQPLVYRMLMLCGLVGPLDVRLRTR